MSGSSPWQLHRPTRRLSRKGLARPERNGRSELPISCRHHTRSGIGWDGDLLKSKRRSNHAPDGLRPDGEPDGSVSARTHLRDDTGPHSLKHHTRNLLRPDPPQDRMPTAELRGELLRCDRAKGSDAANLTVIPQLHLHLYGVPPSALPPSMVDEVACGDGQERNSLGERRVENFTP